MHIKKGNKMKFFLSLAFLFFVGSISGWVLEIIYRRLISTKKWINPGFLTGPYLPIYGFGLCTLYIISKVDMSFLNNPFAENILTIIFMMLAMTLIEYIAGIIFIKGMNVKLLDYSNEWGNIQGIICPLYTAFWGILGAIYYYFINPTVIESINWLYDNLIFSFFIGLFFGVVIIDAANATQLAVKIKKVAKEYNILVRLEELKNNIRDDAEKSKDKIHYIFALKSNKSWKDLLETYKDRHLLKRR